MRVVFDILGSTARSGGMRLHSTELLGAWLDLYPRDETVIVGGEWARDHFAPRGARVWVWPNESAAARAVGQLLVSPLAAVHARADVVISLSPIVSPLVPRGKAVCFQHDWRHKRNPREFPGVQRAYRKLWELSARRARVNICVSRKAAIETTTYVGGAVTAVVENGRDHARDWAVERTAGATGDIVTFGHHNNKRPELVIEAFARALDRLPYDTNLIVLGTPDAYTRVLRARASALGVSDRVLLPGFVSQREYQQTVGRAGVVVMASSDEGFGLPIAEAQYFGIPAVITSDSGMQEVFGTYPVVAEPDSTSLAEALHTALSTTVALSRAAEATWRDTATRLRTEVLRGSA